MLGLDLAEAFYGYLAESETNTDLRPMSSVAESFSARCPSCSHRQRCNFFVNRLRVELFSDSQVIGCL